MICGWRGEAAEELSCVGPQLASGVVGGVGCVPLAALSAYALPLTSWSAVCTLPPSAVPQFTV